MAAQRLVGLAEIDLIAAQGQHAGAFQAGRAGADHQHGPGVAASKRSGCQPRRYSSITVGFWVQMMVLPRLKREMQTLQPMHSQMSSVRPSSILRGSQGSAIEGRAQPMMSSWPDLITRTISSGSVKRPTPTTGTLAMRLTSAFHGAWWLVL